MPDTEAARYEDQAHQKVKVPLQATEASWYEEQAHTEGPTEPTENYCLLTSLLERGEQEDVPRRQQGFCGGPHGVVSDNKRHDKSSREPVYCKCSRCGLY